MRKLLSAALLAAVPLGLLVTENFSSAAERGLRGKLFSKKSQADCT
ncbi:MAG: hypothetical protein RIR17_1095, partial [Planctomycetota bacterium]